MQPIDLLQSFANDWPVFAVSGEPYTVVRPDTGECAGEPDAAEYWDGNLPA